MVSDSVKSENRIMACGIFHQVCKPSFIWLNKFFGEFLEMINIASLACQSKSCNLANALILIDECCNNIADLVNIYSFEKIERDLQVLKNMYDKEHTTQSRRMDYIINIHIPTNADDCEDAIKLRRVVIDCFQNELDARFASANTVHGCQCVLSHQIIPSFVNSLH